MSDSEKSERGSSASASDDGVLANLPPTRPQRTSRRRTEARNATARATRKAPARAASRGPDRGDEERSRERRVAPRHEPVARKRAGESAGRRDSAPKQGFESESDAASGPVQPPGAVELVGSAVEIVAELARGGLSAGERLLGDLVSRLPRP